MKRSLPMMFAAALALAGCAVAPYEHGYGHRYHDHAYYGLGYYGHGYYGGNTVIVTPAPRIEYRGPVPGPGYVWIGGYWNRIGTRHAWVPGRWAAPPGHLPPPAQQWRPPGERTEQHRRETRKPEAPGPRPPAAMQQHGDRPHTNTRAEPRERLQRPAHSQAPAIGEGRHPPPRSTRPGKRHAGTT
jgi:hypothetical protein